MTLTRMKRNSDPFSRLVILVDDVVAIRTVRTVQLDFFRLQLIEQVCRQPAPSRCFFIWSTLITFTNHSEQYLFTVVVGGGAGGRKASSRQVTSAMLGFSNRTGADQLAALLGVNWVRSAEGGPPE
jgi:hypothetical protein